MKLSILSFVQLTLLTLLPSITNGLGLYDEASCGCHPDPHFHTWDGTWYDYQGECEVVLIKKIADPSDPNDTLSLEVQIATKPQGGYSSIDSVGVRINGDDLVLESSPPATTPSNLGGYPITTTVSPYPVYEIDLGASSTNDFFIRIIQYTYGFSVQVQGNGALFMNAEGMCGSWNSGGVADRAGTPFTTTDTFLWAQEWQVTPGESIFPSLNGACEGPPECGRDFPEPPEGQVFPCKREEGRDQGRDLVNADEIDCNRTCNDIPAIYPELRNNCLYDVIVTGNKNFACQPAYVDPVIIKHPDCKDPVCISAPRNACEKNGGKCVPKCVPSLKVSCNPYLCREYNPFEEFPPKLQESQKDRCACAIPVRPVLPYKDAVMPHKK